MIFYIVVFNVVCILAHKLLPPFGIEASVMSEESLRERELTKKGNFAKAGEVTVDMPQQASTACMDALWLNLRLQVYLGFNQTLIHEIDGSPASTASYIWLSKDITPLLTSAVCCTLPVGVCRTCFAFIAWLSSA